MPSQCSVCEVGVEIGVFWVGCMILWLDGINNHFKHFSQQIRRERDH